jgi:hypothetical protein
MVRPEADPLVPLPRLRRRLVGHRPAAPAERGGGGHASAADRQQAAGGGPGPSRRAAQRGPRPRAEVRVPQAERARGGGLRLRALLRPRLDRRGRPSVDAGLRHWWDPSRAASRAAARRSLSVTLARSSTS